MVLTPGDRSRRIVNEIGPDMRHCPDPDAHDGAMAAGVVRLIAPAGDHEILLGVIEQEIDSVGQHDIDIDLHKQLPLQPQEIVHEDREFPAMSAILHCEIKIRHWMGADRITKAPWIFGDAVEDMRDGKLAGKHGMQPVHIVG